MLEELKSKVNKLEEDNAKLRRALEQSMTRLNRMSLDSDYLVDRLAGLNFELKFLPFDIGYHYIIAYEHSIFLTILPPVRMETL